MKLIEKCDCRCYEEMKLGFKASNQKLLNLEIERRKIAQFSKNFYTPSKKRVFYEMF